MDQSSNLRPAHYGGPENPFEPIKVIKAWGHDNSFNLGSVLKYLGRFNSGKSGDSPLVLLRKIRTYIDFEIARYEEQEKEKEEEEDY